MLSWFSDAPAKGHRAIQEKPPPQFGVHGPDQGPEPFALPMEMFPF